MKKYFSLGLITMFSLSLFAQKDKIKPKLDSLKTAKNTTNNSTNKDDYLAKPFNVTTPEVAQLIKSEIIPINYATGKAEYSIPIFEVKEGNISVPVMLKYSSNGIKVNQESTNVGLDWVLIAGGNVTKFVNDIDDNKARVNHNYSTYSSMYYDDFYGWLTEYTPSYDWGQYISKRGRLINDNEIEYAPDSKITPASANYEQIVDLGADHFIAIAPGLTSKFYLNKKTIQDTSWDPRFVNFGYRGHEVDGFANKIYVNKYDKFNIDNIANNLWMGWKTVFPQNCSSSIGDMDFYASQNNYALLKNKARDYDQFQVVNAYGNVYSFQTNDVNVQSSIESPFQLIDNSPQSGKSMKATCKLMFNNNYNIGINTWYLDSVLDVTSNRKVTFKYKEFTQTRSKIADFDKGKGIESSFILNYGNGGSNVSTPAGVPPYEINKYAQNSLYHYVEEINWSGGKVKFFYDFGRSDAFDDNQNGVAKKALSQVVVYDFNGQIIKKVKLGYSYFKNTQVTTDLDVRMKLDNVAFYDKNDTFLYNYILEYNGSVLPSKGTSVATKKYRDVFGYFKQPSIGENPKTYYNIVGQKFRFGNYPLADYTFLYGDLDVTPDNNASLGMLKKITTPTGGYHQFFYEANTFLMNNQEYTGGGVRLSEQRINDGTTERKLAYRYTDQNGLSSGRVGNLPSNVGYRAGDWYDTLGNYGTGPYPTVFQSQQNTPETDDGSFVMYEKVTEEEAGKGKIAFSFTGFTEYPNMYPNTEDHSTGSYYTKFLPIDPYLKNRSQLRGKLKTKEIYAEGASFPSQVETSYYKLAKDVSTNFNVSYLPSYLLKPSWSLIIDNTPENLLMYKKMVRNNFSSINDFTEEQTTHEYFGAAPLLSNGEPVSYNYTETSFLLTKQNVIHTDGSSSEVTYSYPLTQGLQYMTGLNIIATPQQTSIVKKKNNTDSGRYISRLYRNYPYSQADADTKTSGLPLPVEVFSTNVEDNLPVPEMTYDKYDSKGNLQQFTVKNGMPTTVIWGYNQNHPIAKIEGAKLSDIDPSLITPIVDASNTDAMATPNNNESSLLAALDTFRNSIALKNYTITTFTYDSVIGVRSITSPTGDRENYQYDDAYRLEKVLDKSEKVVKEYKYGYIPAIYYYSSAKSQSYTKNNCGTGTYPSVPVTYTVPAGKYSSLISQADADQKATDDVTLNAQNYANGNGNCTYVCSITPSYNADIYYSSFQENSPGHISAILSFPIKSSNGNTPNWSGGVMMGNLGSLCVPGSYKTINVSAQGGSWTVSIYPGGAVYVSGSGAASSTSVTLYFDYTKN